MQVVLTSTGGGALTYSAASHTFSGTIKIASLTVSTTDQIPSLSGYATLASPALTGNAPLNGLTILTQDTTVIPTYYNAWVDLWNWVVL